MRTGTAHTRGCPRGNSSTAAALFFVLFLFLECYFSQNFTRMTLIDIGVAFGVIVTDIDKQAAIRIAYNKLPDELKSLVTIHTAMNQFVVGSRRYIDNLRVDGIRVLIDDELFIKSAHLIESLCDVQPYFCAVAL
jgi:hypothetical protein